MLRHLLEFFLLSLDAKYQSRDQSVPCKPSKNCRLKWCDTVVLMCALSYVHELQEENTALHLAAKQGHSDVLQKIIETGENIDERNIVSLNPIVIDFLV